jgi:flagellar hook-associated protein 2
MAITFSGLATGLDTDKIVSELMGLERAGITRIEARKTQQTERLAAFAQFKDRLDGLKTAVGDMNITSQLRTTSARLSSEQAFTATTTSGATGSFDIAVAQLSQVQKNISAGFASNSEALFGEGTLSINGTVLNINAENNSLLGIAQAINAETKTTGVRASIINDGTGASPYRLVFTGVDAATAFTVESTLRDAAANLIAFTTDEYQTAKPAVVFIDGIRVVSNSNTIDQAINGVSLTLTSVSPTSHGGTAEEETPSSWEWEDPPVYTTTRMDIETDTGAAKEKITAFVTAYNGVMEWINSGYEQFGGGVQAKPGKDDDDQTEQLLGTVLRGDATVNSVKRQLQNMLTTTVNNSGAFGILSELGLTTNRNGTLNQNNAKLDGALESNFDDMVALLSGDDLAPGVMKGFNSLLLDLTSSSKGVYAVQKQVFDSSAGAYDRQIDQMELRLSKREASLRAQFSAMETMVSSLNAQGDFLTQQMDILNSFSRKK